MKEEKKKVIVVEGIARLSIADKTTTKIGDLKPPLTKKNKHK